ncbi:MAG: sigma-70 family RNA polymerase sigma factor [Planctomycetes bacterium]|nr:sigma-70 family RNA polymerase sigma factor [Planctomycetota bacterium]
MAGSLKSEEDSKLLIERAKRGERAAFELLLRRYRERLAALIEGRLGAHLRGFVEPEDILQETLLRAWKSLADFEWQGKGAFFRWLSGIAHNAILEAADRHRPWKAVPLDFDVPASASSPSKALQREERLGRLQEALRSLSPEYRQVIQWVRFEGVSLAEAARRLDRTPNAVSHLLLRAVRKLREILGETESLDRAHETRADRSRKEHREDDDGK